MTGEDIPSSNGEDDPESEHGAHQDTKDEQDETDLQGSRDEEETGEIDTRISSELNSDTESVVDTEADNNQRSNEEDEFDEYDIGELTDDVPVEQIIATVSATLGNSDRDTQSDLLGSLTTSVLQDWTKAFNHVHPGVSVEREDNARLQQVRNFYEEQQEDYERLAAELGVDSYRGLTPSQVLFMADLRRLQETLRDQLPAEPNADAVRLAELFNNRITVSDSVKPDAESVLSDEFSDLRGHPVGERLQPDVDARGYRISDPADRLRTALVHRSLPVENTEDGPEPGDVIFLYAEGDIKREAVSVETEGYIGCVILGAPVSGEQDWFNQPLESVTLYSFQWLYLSGDLDPVDFSCETTALSDANLQKEIDSLLANAARVGESAHRSPDRADQLNDTDVVTESIIVFRTLRSDLLELPAVVVDRPFDGWIPPEILSNLYFPDRRGKRILASIESALRSGKNVILTGPPGTGKTEIAERALTYLAEAYPNYYTGSRTTTATADWSTFDTIGGYMPDRNSNTDELAFDPGLVTRCLRDAQTGRRLNEPLLIDELNRADIDKAFGQLFTALTDQSVELPFRTDDNDPLRIETPARAGTAPDEEAFLLPHSWSLIATINTYDKTSLYEMSYAFMRRFSFIRVDPPTIPIQRSDRNELLAAYAAAWDYNVDLREMEGPNTTPTGQLIVRLGDLWHAVNSATKTRAIGPAIVKDMLDTIQSHRNWQRIETTSEESNQSDPNATETVSAQDHVLRELITDAVIAYVLPQLEGLPEREAIAANIAQTGSINQDEIASAVRESLDLPNFTVDDDSNEPT